MKVDKFKCYVEQDYLYNKMYLQKQFSFLNIWKGDFMHNSVTKSKQNKLYGLSP
jgi:hypothetical protein